MTPTTLQPLRASIAEAGIPETELFTIWRNSENRLVISIVADGKLHDFVTKRRILAKALQEIAMEITRHEP